MGSLILTGKLNPFSSVVKSQIKSGGTKFWGESIPSTERHLPVLARQLTPSAMGGAPKTQAYFI